MKKTVFFGTESFGAGILEALLQMTNMHVVAVVTQPDRPVGRKQEMQISPVKELALSRGITTILQPETLKGFAVAHPELKEVDTFVVCQYGLIIPQSVLDMPKYGVLNVHTSLLPKYRGASPIQSALIHGETTTGVSIMLMDAKMDHGPVIARAIVPIDPNDTYPTLSDRMLPVAQGALVEILEAWPFLESGTDVRTRLIAQDETMATFCGLLSRDDGKLDFSKTAQELYNLYRGTYPWPGVWTTWEGKRLKVLAMKPSLENSDPGIVFTQNNRLLVGTTKGSIELIEVQLEGKKAMPASIFLQGNKNIISNVLGK